jgi:hypothetical protein
LRGGRRSKSVADGEISPSAPRGIAVAVTAVAVSVAVAVTVFVVVIVVVVIDVDDDACPRRLLGARRSLVGMNDLGRNYET